MRDIATEPFTNMQTAVGFDAGRNYRTNFYYHRELPENLGFLDALSWNFYWSWKPEGANLFRELDPQLWERCEQNPRLLLKKIDGLRLWQKANDEEYVAKIRSF